MKKFLKRKNKSNSISEEQLFNLNISDIQDGFIIENSTK